MSDGSFWKVCSICRNPIGFKAVYYACSVSTCQRKRTGLVFCSPACFDAHLPMMRHRDAWADKETSPSEAEAALEADSEPSEAAVPDRAQPARRILGVPAAPPPEAASDGDDVLIVTTRLKKFIRAQSGMNTSDSVLGVLSEHIRQLSVQALRVAATDGRKTVLDRDFEAVLRGLVRK
jgi:histone H3/H4